LRVRLIGVCAGVISVLILISFPVVIGVISTAARHISATTVGLVGRRCSGWRR
jgi:hypothetical protein